MHTILTFFWKRMYTINTFFLSKVAYEVWGEGNFTLPPSPRLGLIYLKIIMVWYCQIKLLFFITYLVSLSFQYQQYILGVTSMYIFCVQFSALFQSLFTPPRVLPILLIPPSSRKLNSTQCQYITNANLVPKTGKDVCIVGTKKIEKLYK